MRDTRTLSTILAACLILSAAAPAAAAPTRLGAPDRATTSVSATSPTRTVPVAARTGGAWLERLLARELRVRLWLWLSELAASEPSADDPAPSTRVIDGPDPWAQPGGSGGSGSSGGSGGGSGSGDGGGSSSSSSTGGGSTSGGLGSSLGGGSTGSAPKS